MAPLRRLIVVVVLALVAGLAPGGLVAHADPGDIGWEGPSWSGATTDPSGDKPESKLWWNDGWWWGSLFDTVSKQFHIFRLNLSTQTWVDTGVALDDRAKTRADTLWDGTHLYVASHIFDKSAEPGSGGRLYRYSYDTGTDTYSLDTGFPVNINDYKTETLVIEKDSTGKLWATWTQDSRVYVNRTVGDDLTWGTPFVPPVSGTTIDADDISSVIAFDGNKIGVMWSNQSDSAMYFAIHVDGQPDTTWEASRTAIQGPDNSDDHINLKSLQSDGSGRVFAAIKTSHTTSAAPLIMLLVRDAATGDWDSYTFGRYSEKHTRPIVMLDEDNRVIHMFATGPSDEFPNDNAAIYQKTAPIDNISFVQGYGTPAIMDADLPRMNDVTSTKQNVNATTGLVILASNKSTERYWHNYIPLGAPTPPAAGFTATPTSGTAPLEVSFADTSTGAPTSWSWDFGDGVSSTQQHPTHSYTAAGTYTVALTVSNGAGSDTETKTNHISVSAAPPVADFTATPTSGAVPLEVSFTDTSAGSPASWSWEFGDGATSNVQHPSHTYDEAGVYTVSLTVTNSLGSDTETKSNLISASTEAVFTPVADAFVNSDKATQNYGGNNNLRVRDGSRTIRSYLKFDVTGLSSTVVSAKLRLWVSDTSLDGGNVYPVADNSWTESGITWDTAPALGASSVASLGAVPTTGTWVETDVTAAVTGNGTLSLALADGVGNTARYDSREGTNAPELVVSVASGSSGTPPTASFTATPTSGTAPLEVSFTDTSTGEPTWWSWDFGDGNTSNLQHPVHTYLSGGTFTVSVTVANGAGIDTSTRVDLIDVTGPASTTFTAVADAFVKSDKATGNYGSKPYVRVRTGTPTIRSYLKFDVSGVSTVFRAVLRLHVEDASPDGGQVYLITDNSWQENTITWDNAPTVGGSAVAVIGPVPTVGEWIEVDVTSAIAVNGTVTLALADGLTNSANYDSRETSNAPQLVINS